ncbi:MAG TPA: glycosyltransferase family 4 protein [Gemmataceae bacterium]|nr:glycosyltransferase family 4 protein [Gemmataceae bacterium]
MARLHLLVRGANRSGGAEVYSAELAARLAHSGHDVTLVCFSADDLLESVCSVCRLREPEFHSLPLLWRFGKALEWLAIARQIAALRLPPPELILASHELYASAYLRRYPGVPMLYIPHSLVAAQEVDGYPWQSRIQRKTVVWLFHHVQRRILNRADRTIRFSHFGCQALRQYYGARIRPRFAVWPAPVNLPPAPTHAPPGPTGPRLLFVGRLVSSKNVSFLLRTLAGLSHPWTLDVIGSGPERQALEAEVVSRGLASRIAFHGHQTDVGRWYRQADLFVFPSRLESFGLVLIEAMSHGVPALCIRRDVQAYHNPFDEIVTDGQDGFLAADEAAFARILNQLLTSPTCLPSVGQNARRTVEQRNSWSEHLRQYESLFGELRRLRPALDRETTCNTGKRVSIPGVDSDNRTVNSDESLTSWASGFFSPLPSDREA